MADRDPAAVAEASRSARRRSRGRGSSGSAPKSRCMSMSMSNSRAMLEDAVDLAVRICCRYRARRRPPCRRRFSAATISSSVPGLLSRPSCGKTQISRSIAQVYSRDRAAGRPRGRAARCPDRPRDGCAYGSCRCRMHFSSVRAARACTSSGVKFCLGAGDLADRLVEVAASRPCSGRGCRTCRGGCGSRRSPATPAGRPRSTRAAVGVERRLDRRDPPLLDADRRTARRPVGQARPLQYKAVLRSAGQ